MVLPYEPEPLYLAPIQVPVVAPRGLRCNRQGLRTTLGQRDLEFAGPSQSREKPRVHIPRSDFLNWIAKWSSITTSP